MAVSLAANLVLVRLLAAEDFGRFAIVSATVGVVASLANARLEDVFLRAPDLDLRPGTLPIFGTALLIELLLILLVSVAVLALANLLDLAAVCLVVGSAATSWVAAQKALYERDFDYKRLGLLQLIGQSTAQILAVMGAVLALGPIVLFARPLVGAVIEATALGAMGKLRKLPLRSLRVADWRFLWSRVGGFWGDGLLEQTFGRLVILAVGALAGERVTGFFYQARLLTSAPHSLVTPLTFRIRMNALSHHTERRRRALVTLRSLGLSAGPLLIATTLAFCLADPLIPWFLGSDWGPAVPLFRGMLGVLPGVILLDTLKAYFMAEGRIAPLLWLGRGGQYLGAVAGTGTAMWLGVEPALSLALGLSTAYLVPVLALTSHLARQHQRTASP